MWARCGQVAVKSIITVMLVKNAKILFVMTMFEARRFKMYPTEAAASVLSRLIEILFYVTFWLIVAEYSESTTIIPSQIISYYLIINGITSFFFTQLGIGSLMNRMIKSGNLNTVLIKPVSPLLVPWSQRAGRNFFNMTLGGIQVIIGVIIAGGLTFNAGILLPFILFNTIVLNLAFNFIVGTFAFYFTEASGIKNSAVHIYNLCGGVLIPLFLMPASVASALQFTPFPAGQYHMAILLQGVYTVQPMFVAIGCMWAVGLMAFAIWFWKYSLRKYEAIGI